MRIKHDIILRILCSPVVSGSCNEQREGISSMDEEDLLRVRLIEIVLKNCG